MVAGQFLLMQKIIVPQRDALKGHFPQFLDQILIPVGPVNLANNQPESIMSMTTTREIPVLSFSLVLIFISLYLFLPTG